MRLRLARPPPRWFPVPCASQASALKCPFGSASKRKRHPTPRVTGVLQSAGCQSGRTLCLVALTDPRCEDYSIAAWNSEARLLVALMPIRDLH